MQSVPQLDRKQYVVCLKSPLFNYVSVLTSVAQNLNFTLFISFKHIITFEYSNV